MSAYALNLINQHFWTPTMDVGNELLNGCYRSFTQDDVKNCLFNDLICVGPVLAGGGTAYTINRLAHEFFPENRIARNICSILSTTAAVITGATLSYAVASRLNLLHIPADKAVKFAALSIVPHVISTLLPGYAYKASYVYGLSTFPLAAIPGYLGSRSLFVIGALSSLYGALSCSEVFHRYSFFRI